MARNPVYAISFNGEDQSGEPLTFSLNTADLVTVATAPAIVTDLLTALDAELHVGLDVQNYITRGTRKVSNSLSEGNREDKVQYVYQDNVTLALYNVEIPSRVGGIVTEAGSDLIPPAQWVDTKAALEAYRSPDGNAITVLEARLIGRSS
jgi:hypothetical protein